MIKQSAMASTIGPSFHRQSIIIIDSRLEILNDDDDDNNKKVLDFTFIYFISTVYTTTPQLDYSSSTSMAAASVEALVLKLTCASSTAGEAVSTTTAAELAAESL